MKAAVSLRLRPSRTEFLVFFPFSNDMIGPVNTPDSISMSMVAAMVLTSRSC